MRFFTVIVAFCMISQHAFGVEKPSIAIFDLETSGCSEMEAKSITKRIRTELFLTGQFIVLERKMVEEVLKEQGFRLAGCTSSECVIEAGQILGVEKIVAGSLDKLGNLYTINLRMIDVKTGQILSAARADCMGEIEDVALNSVLEVVSKLIGKPVEQPLSFFSWLGIHVAYVNLSGRAGIWDIK